MILRTLQTALTVFLTLSLIWFLGWLWYAASIVSMKPEQPGTKTDAIIVLTGGEKRIAEGLKLLDEGLSGQLFISGVNPRTHAEDIIAGWKQNRTPPCCVTLGYQATDTIGNADEAAQWVKKNNIQTIRLVTSTYHIARAQLEFENALPDHIILVHPVTPDDFEPWNKQFWPLTFREYTKLIGSFIRVGKEKVFA